MKRIKLFISSVQSEFASERAALCDYIRGDALLGKFFQPFIFEELPAENCSAPQAFLSEAAACDIYVGLLGDLYGYENEAGISPTEQEYDVATQNKKHRLIFIKSRDEACPVSTARQDKETAFIAKVEKSVVRKTFSSYEDLRNAVYASLIRYLEEKEYLRLMPFDATFHHTATLKDIDDDKVSLFVSMAQKKRGFPLAAGANTQTVLTHLDLLSEDGRITNSALLLFGKHPQRFFVTSEVKCAQFYGNEITKPIPAYQVYRGTVFELIDQAVAFVMSRIDARVGTRDKSTDVDIDYELPLKAVTEGVVNAITHRDYTSNGSVQVMLFKNRLEIWNPGYLPFGLTVERLLIPHPSLPPNPLLANPIYLAGYIERMGTGTGDIVSKCLALGLKQPEFLQEEDFKVTLWRSEKENEGVNLDFEGINAENEGVNINFEGVKEENEGVNINFEGVKESLQKELSKIYTYIKNNPLTKSADIEQLIGKSNATAERYLKILKDNKLIEYSGSDKTGGYRIIE
jgi:predicted HTH transcriptional regulator